MSIFKNKNSLRAIEAQIVQRLKNNELGQNLLVLIKKKRVALTCTLILSIFLHFRFHFLKHVYSINIVEHLN